MFRASTDISGKDVNQDLAPKWTPHVFAFIRRVTPICV